MALELEQLIEQLRAHGTSHGNWELCFKQLTDTITKLMAAHAEEVLDLTARIGLEQDNVRVQTRLRLISEGRLRQLDALMPQKDKLIAQLQASGYTVLAELLRLRKKYEAEQTATSSDPGEAARSAQQRDA